MRFRLWFQGVHQKASVFLTNVRRRVGIHLRQVVWPRLKLRLKQFSVLLITKGAVPLKARYLKHRPMVWVFLKKALQLAVIIAALFIARSRGVFGEDLSSEGFQWWVLGVLIALCVVLVSVFLYRKGVRIKKFSLPSFASNRFSLSGFLKLALLVFVIFFFKDVIVATATGIWDIRPTKENLARWKEEDRVADEAARKARTTEWSCTYDLSEYGTGRHVANHDAKFLKPDDREAWSACLFDTRRPDDMSNEQLNNFWKDRFPALEGKPSTWDVIIVKNRSAGTVSCLLHDTQNNGYFREQFSGNAKHEGEQYFEIYDVSGRFVTGGDPPGEGNQKFRITC